MPLLNPSEITIEALQADLAMQRSVFNQAQMQMMTLQEGLSLAQNPIERTSPIRTLTALEGDTLQIISAREFGTPNYWRAIAEQNKLQYPYLLQPGQVIALPEINRGL